MNREVVDKWCERGILALVLCILVFGTLATGGVRTVDFLVIQGLSIGVMLLWVVRLWVKPEPRFLWPPICWTIVAFLAYAVGRYSTAPIEYVARAELIHLLVYGFLFLAVLNNLHHTETARIICFVMFGLATVESGYALFQYFTNSDHVWGFIRPVLYRGRGSGSYICPNHLAGFLEMLLPLAISYFLVARSKALTRVFVGYAAVVILAGIGSTISRGGWLACGAGLMALFGLLAFQRNYRFPAIIFMCLMLAGAVALFIKLDPLKKRFSGPPDMQLARVTESMVRLDVWRAAVEMWEDNPWFGVGPGHFDYVFRLYRPQEMQSRPEYTHNEYLNALADWGAVGTGIIAAGLVFFLVGATQSWSQLRRKRNDLSEAPSSRFAFVLGATCGVFAILVHSLVDFNLQIPANAILAVCLVALLTGYLRFSSERWWRHAGWPLRGILSFVLLGGASYLGWQGCRSGQESLWLNRADREPLYSPAQISLLKKAMVVEPMNFDTAYRIGEAYRLQSFEGGDDYVNLAHSAMDWYTRATQLNALDGANYLRYGMCLDWIGRHDEAWGYFNRADELEPNSCFTASSIGWHYVQVRNFAAARIWFQRSLLLLGAGNEIASSYYDITRQRLFDAAGTNNVLKLPQ